MFFGVGDVFGCISISSFTDIFPSDLPLPETLRRQTHKQSRKHELIPSLSNSDTNAFTLKLSDTNAYTHSHTDTHTHTHTYIGRYRHTHRHTHIYIPRYTHKHSYTQKTPKTIVRRSTSKNAE